MIGKIKILLLVLVVLTGLVLLVENPFSNRFDWEETALFPGLKKEEVTAVEIKNLAGEIRLTKNEKGEWEVDSVPADPAKVEQVIALLSDLKKGTPVSSNPEKHGLFEVTEVGLSVTLFDKEGKKIAGLFVGKQGPNFFSTFIRPDKSSEVYLSDAHFHILKQPLEEWEKKEEKEAEPAKPQSWFDRLTMSKIRYS